MCHTNNTLVQVYSLITKTGICYNLNYENMYYMYEITVRL